MTPVLVAQARSSRTATERDCKDLTNEAVDYVLSICHSEHSEDSLLILFDEILRYAQGDKLFFRL